MDFDDVRTVRLTRAGQLERGMPDTITPWGPLRLVAYLGRDEVYR